MKKTLLILVAALIAAACAASSTDQGRTAPANANTSAVKPAATFTEADAIAREKEIWATFDKKDYDAFAAMLANDFIYVAPEAVYDKAGSVKGVNGFVPTDVVFSDWKFLPIDKDAAVIVYTVKFKSTMGGEAMPPAALYGSSVWVNRAGKWLGVYHQETEIPATPPPAPPASTKTPKAAASPAATTPATPAVTTANVEANEKAVWEALKAKKYDVFASYLAPEATEVEPVGVMDRAGSIKGVQTVDLSKATLSDWKTLKFDDDASLVTYTVKIPGAKPDTERHSTIWANKNGKWMALFHQGTLVKPMMAMPKKAASKIDPLRSSNRVGPDYSQLLPWMGFRVSTQALPRGGTDFIGTAGRDGQRGPGATARRY